MHNKRYEDFYNEAKQYEHILKTYKETGQQFVDPNFHPTLKIIERKISISDSPSSWARIDDICKAPLFQSDLIHYDFVCQGELGDCYFIAALSRVARQPYLVPDLFDREMPNKILGEVKDSINIKCGAVVVYLRCFGRKTPILIDTLLPVKYGRFKFSHPSDNSKSAWFCLIEKAYAKLIGSYSDIVGGHSTTSFYHLFGYYPMTKTVYQLEKEAKITKISPFYRLIEYQRQGAVLTASIHLDQNKNGITKANVKKHGLHTAHCYLIQKVREHGSLHLLCLRNPWGNGEWTGDWSDDSPLWTTSLKKALGWKNVDDGTFWMCEADFFNYFTKIDVAQALDPKWYIRKFCVQLEPGDHDGHGDFDEKAKLDVAPNYAFQVIEPIQKGEVCEFRVIVEKRCNLFDIKKNCYIENPNYNVLFVHNEGQKICYKTLKTKKRFANEFSRKIISCKHEVTSNDDIVTIALQRTEKCDIYEDCYVFVICTKNFKLYDVDHPEVQLEEVHAKGYVFDNFSINHPYDGRPINIGQAKGHIAFVLGDIDLNAFNPNRENLLGQFNDEINKKRQELGLTANIDDSTGELNDQNRLKFENKRLMTQLEIVEKEKEDLLAIKNNEILNLKKENSNFRDLLNRANRSSVRNEEDPIMQTQLNKANKKLSDSLNEKNEEISSLKKENSSLQTQLNKANKKLSDSLNEKNEEISNLKKENSKIQTQFSKENKKLKDSLSEKNEEVSNLMKEISQLKDQLHKANKKLSDSMNSKNEEIANLKKENSDLQSQLSKANKKIDNPSIAQNVEILDLKNENSSLQNQLNKSKKEKEEMVNILHVYQKKYNEMYNLKNEELQQLKLELDQLKNITQNDSSSELFLLDDNDQILHSDGYLSKSANLPNGCKKQKNFIKNSKNYDSC